MAQDFPNPRRVAAEILRSVLSEKRTLDGALATHGGFPRLERRDRAFVRHLVTTTLRRLGQIDDAIGRFLNRPLPGKADDAAIILRLAACQLLFLGTPPHAAVSTALELMETERLSGFKGVVNAVLRRIASDVSGILSDQDPERLNMPDWLWDSLIAAYGENSCRRIARAHAQEPPLDVSVRADAAAWAEKLGGVLLPTGSVRLSAEGPVPELPGFADGAWWVQDAAAALPVRMLGSVADQHVVDLCAAPGGKTAQLLASGARVTALDRSEGRLRLVRENLDRLGMDAELVVADATRWRPPESADALLIDAPCSATGTIRRNPDISWIRDPKLVERTVKTQKALLAQAARIVKPGGRIVFSTCSLLPEEGPAIVADALARGVLKSLPLPEIAEIEPYLQRDAGSVDCLRTFPWMLDGAGGMDGFYAALLQRP